MASFCELCGKKIGFLDCTYSVANVNLCVDCFYLHENVLNSIGDEDFAIKIDAFKSAFVGNKHIEKIVEQLNQSNVLGRKNSNEIENTKNSNIGPFEGQDLIYTIDGVRGRHIDVYKDKVVITTRVTIGSLLTDNATDGEKTIYYVDCIGVQFKPSKFTIGYLQLETASSSGNNKHSDFFDENSFTFDKTVISNERMSEVTDYIKSCIDNVKKSGISFDTRESGKVFVADELLKLKQLLDMGVLSQEEFDAQKNKLLSK